jgi:hypothetical protein
VLSNHTPIEPGRWKHAWGAADGAPGWISDDLYPLKTIERRKRYYAPALPEKWLTMFTHDAKLPWAYLERE